MGVQICDSLEIKANIRNFKRISRFILKYLSPNRDKEQERDDERDKVSEEQEEQELDKVDNKLNISEPLTINGADDNNKMPTSAESEINLSQERYEAGIIFSKKPLQVSEEQEGKELDNVDFKLNVCEPLTVNGADDNNKISAVGESEIKSQQRDDASDIIFSKEPLQVSEYPLSDNTFNNMNISYAESRNSTESWKKGEKTLSGYFLQKNIKKIQFSQSKEEVLTPEVEVLDIIMNEENKTYLLGKKNNRILMVEDYDELTDGKMLSNPLLEYVLEIMTDKNENVMFIDCYLTNILFAAHIKNIELLSSVEFNKNIVLLPLHQGIYSRVQYCFFVVYL